MNATTDPDAPRQRKPGGGRKPGYHEPVTIVSISMHPEQLRAIDREALQSNRSRSAFVRWILRARCLELEQGRDDRRIERETYDERGELRDPTHGGRFDPALKHGERWSCPTCAEATKDDPAGPSCQTVVAGWIVCPGCKTPRPLDTYPEDHTLWLGQRDPEA